MKLHSLFFVGTMLLIGSSPALAQDRVRIELLPGAAFVTEKMADADLKTGAGADLVLSYRLQPHLAAYGGWGWRRFTADRSFAGSNIDAEETGYSFGLRFEHPVAGSKTSSLVLRVGGTYNHIEVEDNAGKIVVDSGHGLGFEVGAGIAIALGDRWQVTPGVRFRSLKRDFELGRTLTPGNLRYVAVEVGLSRSF